MARPSGGISAVSRQCEECGTAFQPKLPWKRFCSEPCQRKRESERTIRSNVTCEGCGTAFRPKRTDRQRFCSRACTFAHMATMGTLHRAVIPRALRRVSFTVLSKVCVGCRSRFIAGPAQFYCSTQCRPPTYERRSKVHSHCSDCGVPVLGTMAKRFCDRCGRKRSRAARKHIDRARHYGVEYEPINPIKVFERDGWRCQVCGVRTPKANRGSYKPNAPELDHRVALSMGGGHVWSNVQCCCRSCNAAKGAGQPKGQMHLFPHAA